MLPIEHLSASSISTFLRCPRQFQEHYIRKTKGPSNSSLVIGSAVHLGLSRVLKDEPPGNFFEEVVTEHNLKSDGIIWKDTQSSSKMWAEKMLSQYYEQVGKYLDVLETEKEMLIDIPGIDIPLLGYIDIKTPRGVIDVKTTGYVSRTPQLNIEWKLQMNIYQVEDPKPGEFHILTRNKAQPIVVPDSPEHPFYVPLPDNFDVMLYAAQIYSVMEHYYETFGEDQNWPGNLTHPWAARYCPLGSLCCQK